MCVKAEACDLLLEQQHVRITGQQAQCQPPTVPYADERRNRRQR
jgi:hypothetical protein